MIVVTVHLVSARTRKVTLLGRAEICNDGTSERFSRGNYTGEFWRKRPGRWRVATVSAFPRHSYSVWELLKRLLNEIDVR